ncbi:hypothetical protein LMG6871_00606 [Ralstonia edaphis]|uniref:hypothetical protein n=1 Tax=Ralstonia edaphi TaxID=3058599 RepID=UPI0028F6A758|nr:hypothetical protein [Ralstonia sp. LMG 6871]CAJ0712971.1 hypothetical protein LMG6871_00606 [Ralstonia sp. LMG 6871]
MKRRRILGAIAGMVALPRAATGTSLYGTPASVDLLKGTYSSDPLHLVLDTSTLPPAISGAFASFGRVWDQVLTNANEKTLFQRDPAAYLKRHGIPESILGARDQEVRLLLALCDERVLSASIRGDYVGFLSELSRLAVTHPTTPSVLKRRVLDVLRGSRPTFRRGAGVHAVDAESVSALATDEELKFIYSQIAPSIDQVAVASIPVAIAAIVVMYVSVATNVTVAILAGVYVSVAVAVAVAASGGANCGLLPDTLFAGPMTAPIPKGTSRSDAQRAVEHAFAERALMAKRMLALDPTRFASAQQTARLARLLNQDEFVLETNRQLVRDEVDAFVAASEQMGILSIPEETRKSVVEAMQNISLRAAALI